MIETLAAVIFLVMAYLTARVVSYAYFDEKLQYHKRLMAAMKKEESLHGKPS